MMRIHKDQLQADTITAVNISALNTIIMSMATWEKVLAKRAMGIGTQSVTDHPATMWTRLSSKFDTLDNATVKVLCQIYITQWEGNLEDLVDAEEPVHHVLVSSSRHHTDDQCMRYFRSVMEHRPEVRAALERFDSLHPSTSMRTLVSLITYMLTQDANIQRGINLSRSSIYPNAPTATAVAPPQASHEALSRDFEAMSIQQHQPMYSQAQREEHAAQAVAAAAQKHTPPDPSATLQHAMDKGWLGHHSKRTSATIKQNPPANNGVSLYCHKHG
jgi:hypothetical protein